MSTRLPGIDASRVGNSGGVGGIDGQGSLDNDINLGQLVGGMGAIDLLGSQRQLAIRANAVDLVIGLDRHRDRSAAQVIASLA